ncbi:MAG: SpoIIE family protein phosphatase [Betaproteobacteria bacterium]
MALACPGSDGSGSAGMMMRISGSTRPPGGESDCSDRCGWWSESSRIVMALADGLGHRPAYAAEIAIACIGAGLERSIAETFAACDVRLRDTGGVALAVAFVDLAVESVTMASVGHIRVALLKGNTRYHLRGSHGIVGGGHDRLTPETRPLAHGDTVMLFSDGAAESGALGERCEGAAPQSLDQIRTDLNRWVRKDDDAAVLIYHHEARTIQEAILQQGAARFRLLQDR